MSITAEGLNKVNESVKKIEIRGKNYACVPARIAAFRRLCPDGAITTEIVSMENGVVTMKSSVCDETGKLLATGYAQEKESSSYINKTSYIENCETSAVGRALGMIGIGSDEQLASSEEMVNALTNQAQKPNLAPKKTRTKDLPPKAPEPSKSSVEHGTAGVEGQLDDPITPKQALTLRMMCKRHSMPEEKIYGRYGRHSMEELTLADWVDFGKTGQNMLNEWDQEHAG